MPEINYFWDELEDNVVREYDENNNTIAQYATEPTLYGSVLTQVRGGEKRYFQFDGLGNTTELTNVDGDVTDMRRVAAFGMESSATGTTVLSLVFLGARGYTDTACIACYYVRHRTYSNAQGRWVSVDPLRASWGQTTYCYSRNSPIYSNDPSGLESTESTTRCKQYYEETVRHHATFLSCWNQFVTFAKGLADEKRREECLKVNITCDDKCPRNVAAHTIYPWPERPMATIYMCTGHSCWSGRDADLAASILCHELIHVLQLKPECVDRPYDPNDCLNRVAMEMRAYYCTGECNDGKSCRMLPGASDTNIGACKPKGLTVEQSLYVVRDLNEAILKGGACAISTRK